MLVGRAGAGRVSKVCARCRSNRGEVFCLEFGLSSSYEDKSIFNKVLTNLQHNFAVILAFLHQRVGLTRLLQRKDLSDHGMELAGYHPF
jgi:hypothetical protein